MRMLCCSLALLTLLLAIAPACAQVASASTRIADVASQYRSWGRVDDELRWAPWLCRMPMPSTARLSAAPGSAHDRKIYFVYARDRAAYLATTRQHTPVAVGQVVVKESFHPRALAAGERRPYPSGVHDDPHDAYLPATDGDASFGPGAPGGLYVMTYLGEHAADTDRGWLYGTVAPTGEVTSAGAIASCIGCHREASHEGLFGLSHAAFD